MENMFVLICILLLQTILILFIFKLFSSGAAFAFIPLVLIALLNWVVQTIG